MKHFLFEVGEWLGTGQVSFTISPDIFRFRVKWAIFQQGSQAFNCIQTVLLETGDQIINVFTVSPEKNVFTITLENQHLGTFSGEGVVEPSLVAWDFRDPGVLEGCEVYELVKEDEYHFRSEYLSSDFSRTTIEGRIWKKFDTEKVEDK